VFADGAANGQGRPDFAVRDPVTDGSQKRPFRRRAANAKVSALAGLEGRTAREPQKAVFAL
jgi:hypothetical protein